MLMVYMDDKEELGQALRILRATPSGVRGSLFGQHLFVMPWRPPKRDLKHYNYLFQEKGQQCEFKK